MNDAELVDLKVWAQRRNPAIPGLTHFYYAACPFCRSESTDPGDGPGRHDVAFSLIEEVERLRTLVAALTVEDTSADLRTHGDGLAEAVGWLIVCLTDPSANGYDGGTSRAVARQRVEAWEALRRG